MINDTTSPQSLRPEDLLQRKAQGLKPTGLMKLLRELNQQELMKLRQDLEPNQLRKLVQGLQPNELQRLVEALFSDQTGDSLQDVTEQDLEKLAKLSEAAFPDPTKLRKSNTSRRPGSAASNLSKNQQKKLVRQLGKFGYRRLFDYLRSPEFKELKERYRGSGLPQKCVVCKDPNVDLHHRTYARLGEERLTDLIPLCRHHHDQLHDEGLDLWSGPGILYEREMERRQQSGLGRQRLTPRTA